MPLEQYQKDGRISVAYNAELRAFLHMTAMSVKTSRTMLGVYKFMLRSPSTYWRRRRGYPGKAAPPAFNAGRHVAGSSTRPSDQGGSGKRFCPGKRWIGRHRLRHWPRRLSPDTLMGTHWSRRRSSEANAIYDYAAGDSRCRGDVERLEGVQSSVAPDKRREEDEKWRTMGEGGGALRRD